MMLRKDWWIANQDLKVLHYDSAFEDEEPEVFEKPESKVLKIKKRSLDELPSDEDEIQPKKKKRIVEDSDSDSVDEKKPKVPNSKASNSYFLRSKSVRIWKVKFLRLNENIKIAQK